MLRRSELDAAIDDVLRGERDAFRKILRAYGLSLRTYIATQVHSVDDIDDLAQEVLLVAYRSLGEFRRGDDFGAWLRGIARHKIYDHFRRTSRRHKALERFRDEVARLIEDRLERTASRGSSGAIEILLACIGQLPERMRRVVRAGLDGHKPADVAGEMMTTVGAVYRLHYRANHLLRDCMQRKEP
jgi:RNA polymerase sigma-70 factor (ECF subfamily)